MAGNSTADLVQGWLSSNGAASSPEQASGKEPIPEGGATVGGDSDDDPSQSSSIEDLLPGGEDTPPDSRKAGDPKEQASSDKAKSQAPKTSGDKELLTISDEKGRRKVEVDYGNRDQMRKYVQMAHGARKWQAERDQARQEVTQVRTERDDLKGNWSALESAFQKSGVEGIVDLLEGRTGAYQAWFKKQIDRHEYLRDASPEEKAALEARETADKSTRELERIRKENEEFRKQMQQEKEQADLHSLESRLHPTFDKYRFADKLGDANDEHMFDEMLWNSAIKRLEPYEEKGLTLTPEIIEKEFRSVAMAIRKRIGLQAEKRAAKVVEQKKQEATENAQAKVRSGYKSEGGTAKEARDLIEGRNLTGLLSNWKKYGSLFNK